jgi:hypothetical protein
VLRGSRPVIAGRQLVVEDLTVFMPVGGLEGGLEQRGNVGELISARVEKNDGFCP